MTKTRLLLVTLLALAYPRTTLASAQPDCNSSCGDLTIPYPFGIGTGCFRDGFEITCNTTTNKQYTATLAGTTIPVLNLSLEVAAVQVQLPIGWQCYNESGVDSFYLAEGNFNLKDIYRPKNKSRSNNPDWAGSCDRKSTTGFCTFVGGNLVTWKSKKQNVVARSSAEAEYRAMASTASELIWIKQLLTDMKMEHKGAMKMYCDNQAARHIASNPVFHERTKHIEVDCHFVREKVQAGEIETPFVKSKEQLADVFTKALDKAIYCFHQPMYRISNTHNLFVVIGCLSRGYLQSQKDSNGLYPYDYDTGCMSYCNDSNSIIDGSCSGVGCCQVTIPSGLSDGLISFSSEIFDHTGLLSFSRCDYGFLVDKDWFKFGKSNLTMSTSTSVPVWLNWAIRENNNCTEAQKRPESYGCSSTNSKCYDSVNGPGYLCKCLEGYQGNPYIVNGCADINECELPDEYPCHGICYNKEGSYDCKCESGKHGNPFNNSCTDNFSPRERLAIGISAGTVSLLFVILSMIFVYQKRQLQRERDTFVKDLEREKETFVNDLEREKETLFKRSEGLILFEQLASRKVDMMNFFRVEELKKITENFSRVIGQGGQGMVYKGRLEDNREVAVKRCIVDNEKIKEGFINELVILSQINHKNIVRLVGCCLQQQDVPMLVYEYIPQGTLSSFLHENQSDISLEIRLKICIDSAKALDHLHSDTVQPILHGDVKSTNILLDNNYLAKVSDFGISRFLSMDMTQVTDNPRGTLGYI
ncbi:wall-associated receptor kinase 2-like [Carex rostrata]